MHTQFPGMQKKHERCYMIQNKKNELDNYLLVFAMYLHCFTYQQNCLCALSMIQHFWVFSFYATDSTCRLYLGVTVFMTSPLRFVIEKTH